MIIHIKYLTILLFLVIACFGCKGEKPTTNTKDQVSEVDSELNAINTSINQEPTNANLYFERSKIYYEKGNLEKANLDIVKAMSIDSINPSFYHLLSDISLDLGKSKDAIDAMIHVVTLYPTRIPSLLKLSEVKYILEDYDGSILTINEIVRQDPQNAEAYFMLGQNFRAMGDKKRAINSFQTAVEMNSGLTDAWILLGEMYEEEKNPKALKYYESAILSNKNSMQALHAKAYYLQNHGNVPKALEIYKEIINQDKTYVDALLNSGLLYLDMDSLGRAYEQFDIMAGSFPTNYLGFYMRGVVQEKRGNKEAAILDYESASHLNSEDKRAEEALKTLKNH